jgi:hypothetical protein
MLAALQIGRPTKRGDLSFLYVLSIEGANSIGFQAKISFRGMFRTGIGNPKLATVQSTGIA